MNHAVEYVFCLEFHFGDFAEEGFVGFGWVDFVLFFHPYVHHVDSVFGIFVILSKFEGKYFVDVIFIDAAVL